MNERIKQQNMDGEKSEDDVETEKWEHERSRRLSRTLDYLGYNKEMVLCRQQAYRILDQLTGHHKNGYFYTGGSKAEGISKCFESDQDTLFFLKDIVCSELEHFNYRSTNGIERFTIKLTTPGYCILERSNRDTPVADWLNPYLYQTRTKHMLSTSLFKNMIDSSSRSRNIQSHSINGPAASVRFERNVDYDLVTTILCDCPSILQQWATRPRKQDWPPVDVRTRISQMSGNVVASGYDDESHLIWRLCFNGIELTITQCWNDTQTKLYKLLKFINSDILKTKQFGVSSFMLKNIVLWLAETYPQSEFQPGTLFSWLIKTLRLLKRAVSSNYLPYYMIPGRNIIREKIPDASRKYLQKELRRIIKRGPHLLLECEKIKSTMYMTPIKLKEFQEKCNLLEVLYFKTSIRSSQLSSMGFTSAEYNNDDEYKTLYEMKLVLLLTMQPDHSPEQLQKQEGLFEKLQVLLS